jgi:hypothetical protein
MPNVAATVRPLIEPVSPSASSRGAADRRTFLLLSQVYVPDPAAVGQHMADAAAELARRGHRVIVFTARRGYDDPSVTFPAREVIDGVEIRRLPCSSFGKRSLAVRLLGGLIFVLQAIVRGVLLRRVDDVVVSTSPPTASIAAVVIGAVRRARIKYWIMDLNPDQVVALKVVREGSVAVRVFDWLNRLVLSRADEIVVLDRFMAARVARKWDVGDAISIVPPWAHEEQLDLVRHEANPFRRAHGLEGKFVVMYSGNHAPSNPLTTLIEAARRLRDVERLVFMFVGGGAAKAEVEAEKGPNVRSLPYQPLSELRYSLSAADVHVVTMGDALVGIVHPCKLYGAMAVARPILFIGPQNSHVAEIVRENGIGWHVRHGEAERLEALLRTIVAMSPAELASMGVRARQATASGLSKAALCGRLCDIFERGGAPDAPRRARAPRTTAA